MEGRISPEDLGVAAFVIARDEERLTGLQVDLADGQIRYILCAR